MSITQDKKACHRDVASSSIAHTCPLPSSILNQINATFEHLFVANGTLPDIIAIGCSGGPDSVALTHMLGTWAKERKIQIHALIVDHRLRADSTAEAQKVKTTLSTLKNVTPFTLTWVDGQDTTTALQERARNARYQLMSAHCDEHDIPYLCTAHHKDDQAETLLFRLAKGTGLDGLGGIQQARKFNDKLTLIRPLLQLSKADLVTYCATHNLPYITDPSNDKELFARVRLRKSYDALQAEGLTPERLSATAQRLSRARDALKQWAQESFNAYLVEHTDHQITLNSAILKDRPEDIIIRILALCIDALSKDNKPYPPRLSRIEAIAHDLLYTAPFKSRTLAGLKFSLSAELLIVEQLPNTSN